MRTARVLVGGNPPPPDRILDTRLWKYYLAPTSLRAVINKGGLMVNSHLWQRYISFAIECMNKSYSSKYSDTGIARRTFLTGNQCWRHFACILVKFVKVSNLYRRCNRKRWSQVFLLVVPSMTSRMWRSLSTWRFIPTNDSLISLKQTYNKHYTTDDEWQDLII